MHGYYIHVAGVYLTKVHKFFVFFLQFCTLMWVIWAFTPLVCLFVFYWVGADQNIVSWTQGEDFVTHHFCLLLLFFSSCFSTKLFCLFCCVLSFMPTSHAVACLLICLHWCLFFSVHAMPDQVPKPCVSYPTNPRNSPGTDLNAYSSFLDHCQSIQAQHGYDVVVARHAQIEMDHGT